MILVHGMGEQRPMDTIKSFVTTVWERDPRIASPANRNPNKVWSKPDERAGSLELRRITTRESVASAAFPHGARTDFYELYWADLTAGSTWDQFVGWIRYLLFRRWRLVPRDVRAAWIVLWILSLLVVAIAIIGLLPETAWQHSPLQWLPRWLFLAVAAGGGALLSRVATRTFGRVVRYTRADPDNIAARAAVRERGLKLLRDLHRGDDYARIVLASHSLGTILAFDLISYFWAERAGARTVAEGSAAFEVACAVERAAAALEQAPGEPAARLAFRDAQASLRRALSSRESGEAAEPGWLISDFVTFGSPLTHAEFLLASSEADLELRKSERELPACPPWREELDADVLDRARATGRLPVEGDTPRLMMFPGAPGDPRWTLHHAAPFAAVRWTNLHDPSSLVVKGDLVSGPLAPNFGPGIEDVNLEEVRGRSGGFSHTHYWSADADPRQIEVLRRAMNLLDD